MSQIDGLIVAQIARRCLDNYSLSPNLTFYFTFNNKYCFQTELPFMLLLRFWWQKVFRRKSRIKIGRIFSLFSGVWTPHISNLNSKSFCQVKGKAEVGWGKKPNQITDKKEFCTQPPAGPKRHTHSGGGVIVGKGWGKVSTNPPPPTMIYVVP